MTIDSLRILFATSECTPWIKTGGLGDVSASLPAALDALGLDVRVLLPAYPAVLAAAVHRREIGTLPATAHFPAAHLFESPLPNGVPALLLDCPALFDRPGNPYVDAAGLDWPDNALRFGLLAHAAAALAGAASPLDWRPQVLHCNDWQTALAPAYLQFAAGPRAATLVTIHNLAFQGLFPAETTTRVGLPASAYAVEGVELYGQMSFLKGGLQYADAINTVSPTYAGEIQREPLGFGLQGLLATRSAVLHGILNGIDTDEWNPATDPLITAHYDAARLAAKAANKAALQRRMGLAIDARMPLFGMVSRLTHQKGADLVAASVPAIAALPAQVVVLGSGERVHEQALEAAGSAHPGAVAIRIGFDEALAHAIEAGADAFLMPSRFEPSGLNQMYSQRYGTPPIAHATGGLVDSIVDCTAATLAGGTATGFLFGAPTAAGLLAAVRRAAALYADEPAWRRLQASGMARDFSWRASAARYAALYASLAG